MPFDTAPVPPRTHSAPVCDPLPPQGLLGPTFFSTLTVPASPQGAPLFSAGKLDNAKCAGIRVIVYRDVYSFSIEVVPKAGLVAHLVWPEAWLRIGQFVLPF